MGRHRLRAVRLDVGHGREVRLTDPVRLGRSGHVCRGLREGVLRLRQADQFQRLAAATATWSARGSALPTSSLAQMMIRRAMNRGSSPAATIVASQ